jgi:hypothetical protein
MRWLKPYQIDAILVVSSVERALIRSSLTRVPFSEVFALQGDKLSGTVHRNSNEGRSWVIHTDRARLFTFRILLVLRAGRPHIKSLEQGLSVLHSSPE